MAHKLNLLGTLALLAASSAGCGDDTYVMFERYELVDDTRKYAGGGCMLVISSGPGSFSAGGGTAGDPAEQDFYVREYTDGDRFIVEVLSEGEELASREYGEKELSSGKRDEFTITTHGGRTFEFAYWGGDECDSSHLPEEAPEE